MAAVSKAHAHVCVGHIVGIDIIRAKLDECCHTLLQYAMEDGRGCDAGADINVAAEHTGTGTGVGLGLGTSASDVDAPMYPFAGAEVRDGGDGGDGGRRSFRRYCMEGVVVDLYNDNFLQCEVELLSSSSTSTSSSTSSSSSSSSSSSVPCRVPWSAVADVVYTCATCYAEDQLRALVQQCANMKRGARVVLVDSEALGDMKYYEDVPLGDAPGTGPTIVTQPPFQLLCSFECEASWGMCCLYVFEKVI
jgi:hypothetical protein